MGLGLSSLSPRSTGGSQMPGTFPGTVRDTVLSPPALGVSGASAVHCGVFRGNSSERRGQLQTGGGTDDMVPPGAGEVSVTQRAALPGERVGGGRFQLAGGSRSAVLRGSRGVPSRELRGLCGSGFLLVLTHFLPAAAVRAALAPVLCFHPSTLFLRDRESLS